MRRASALKSYALMTCFGRHSHPCGIAAIKVTPYGDNSLVLGSTHTSTESSTNHQNVSKSG